MSQNITFVSHINNLKTEPLNIRILKKKNHKHMKQIFLILTFLGFTFMAKAQNTSVEKSTSGVQIGILGIYGYNEAKLTNTIAFRSELGFDFGYWDGIVYPKAGFIFVPTITAEPRLYYNLSNRVKKSKSIAGNSGNFIALKLNFHPNWFTISNYKNIKVNPDISIIPTWGIKRNFGKHFTFETGIGVGYRFYLNKNSYSKNTAALNLLLRIGYRF